MLKTLWKTRKTISKELVNIYIRALVDDSRFYVKKQAISSLCENKGNFSTNSNIFQVNSFFEK